MYTIYAKNPDDALLRGRRLLDEVGLPEGSRNGRVLVAPAPVVTVYESPRDRVSLSAIRDANPFFHLAEALWMLAGRNDVATVARYAKRMEEFSDDGLTLNGAYGHRWRGHFGLDQLIDVIDQLRRNPGTRRAVLTMWDPRTDIALGNAGGKDVPCNTQIYFRLREMPGVDGASSPHSVLDMTVCCRSNDIVWGAYGANVVHFSMMQEFVALAVGAELGTYYQLSNNYHMYIDRPDALKLTAANLALEHAWVNEIRRDAVSLQLFTSTAEAFLMDVADFFRHGTRVLPATDFFRNVVQPMEHAHQAHKEGRTLEAMGILNGSKIDWHIAGYMWLQRRYRNKTKTQEVR